MNRLLLAGAGAAGACAIAIPAALGLTGNPSFSEKIPVRAPSQASVVTFDDHGNAVEHSARPHPSGSTRSSGHHEPEPGDDHGGARTSSEPGDDHGGARTSSEPGDDHGGSGGGSGRDSRGGSGRGSGGGSDDSGRHGGSNGSGGSGSGRTG